MCRFFFSSFIYSLGVWRVLNARHFLFFGKPHFLMFLFVGCGSGLASRLSWLNVDVASRWCLVTILLAMVRRRPDS